MFDGPNLQDFPLMVGDRVAALNDEGTMMKARVAEVVDGMIAVTFTKTDTPHLRDRKEVLPLARDGEVEVDGEKHTDRVFLMMLPNAE